MLQTNTEGNTSNIRETEILKCNKKPNDNATHTEMNYKIVPLS